MKSNVMPLHGVSGTIQLSEGSENEQRTATTEETLAAGTADRRYKKLTAADMWNLQRNSRSATDMLRRWNLN